jgi:hypothetical protein
MRTLQAMLGVVLLAVVFANVAEAQKQKKPRRDPRMITAEEIEERTETNALDLIRALRSNWLNGRGATSILLQERGISVYVDGAKRGSVEELRFITKESIAQMRSLTATDAQARYGMDNVSGAIEVTTKKISNSE